MALARRSAAALASLLLPVVLRAQQLPLDPALVRWARANAVPLPSVDQTASDSAYAFLRPLVGSAKILAVGELMHGAHEPLAFRNQVIRYAVTQLGFTAVAIESGLTEGGLVDRFVQGGPVEIDSVMAHGFSNGFGALGENRELLLWLRGHNAAAKKKVHFYGVDLTGADDAGYGGSPKAIRAALEYLGRVAPDRAAGLAGELTPLIDRFTSAGYLQYTAAERGRLKVGLTRLHGLLATPTPAPADRRERAMAVRNAWMALMLEETFRLSGSEGPRARPAIRLRDSIMAENTRWVLRQEGGRGRLVLFEHNGHVMNIPMAFPGLGSAMTMMGQRLRAWAGPSMVVIGTAAANFTGLGSIPRDMSTVGAVFSQLASGSFALDLRTADRTPPVRALLREPWLMQIHAWFQPLIPREATDVFVYFDQVTPSRPGKEAP